MRTPWSMAGIFTVAAFDAGGTKNVGFYLRMYDGSGAQLGAPVCRHGAAGVGLAVTDLVDALKEGPVALGIEAPCWAPGASHPFDPATFMRKRPFEGTRSWSAPAGAYVSMAGRVLAEIVLQGIVAANTQPRATFGAQRGAEWSEPGDLLLWEAFVSAEHKPPPQVPHEGEAVEEHNAHVADARYAVEEGFLPLWKQGTLNSIVWPNDQGKVVSLVGDALASAQLVSTLAPGSPAWWTGSCMVIAPGSPPKLLHP